MWPAGPPASVFEFFLSFFFFDNKFAFGFSLWKLTMHDDEG
jgi:hypothetical protein